MINNSKKTYNLDNIRNFIIGNSALLPFDVPPEMIDMFSFKIFENIADDIKNKYDLNSHYTYDEFKCKFSTVSTIFFYYLNDFMDECEKLFKNRKNFKFQDIIVKKIFPRNKELKEKLINSENYLLSLWYLLLYFGILKYLFEDSHDIETFIMVN